MLDLLRTAKRGQALGALPDYLMYRTPLAKAWAKMKGHDFQKSALIWFHDDGRVHTRLTLLLPRLALEFPKLTHIDMKLEFYTQDGRLEREHCFEKLSISKPFALDSRRLPKEFNLPTPFNGSLLVKQKISAPGKRPLFRSTHTYIDYYSEGSFITTLHDYCAFLPDQGINEASLGMIPAYANDSTETFLIIHSAKAGIRSEDLKVFLYNAEGEEKCAPLPALRPFSVQKVFVRELFPEADAFLKSGPGQIVVKGIFRMLLRRIAYGVENKKLGTFSLDHCYYNAVLGGSFLLAQQRERIAKGWSNPFFVIENEGMSTSAMVFHSVEEKEEKHIDVLLYDAEGRLAASFSPFARLGGNQTKMIRIRELLKEKNIATPFIGHAEILYHKDALVLRYPKDLDLYVEYNSGGRLANIIFGAGAWNPPQAVNNRSYRSGCRVVCDDVHTTHLAISNCSYDYDYRLNVDFKLNLLVGGQMLESKVMSIGPNATIFKSIEEIFPNAKKQLETENGIGLVTTTDINCTCLTHLFFTEDRRSKAVSVEHSLDV